MQLRTIIGIHLKREFILKTKSLVNLRWGQGKYNQIEEAKDVVLIVHKSGAHKTNCVTIGYLFVEFSWDCSHPYYGVSGVLYSSLVDAFPLLSRHR